MPERRVMPEDDESRVQPKPALGLKIAVGVACGILALSALVIWTLVKALAP